MPRREVLTPAERESLLAFPTDESELIRHYSLSRMDRTFIRQHRGAQNWLGIAIQLCYLRHPDRALGVEETPPPALLGIIAAQLKVSAALWDAYARRDQTRREHQQELVRWLDLKLFTRDYYKELSQWLVETALQTTQSIVLAKAVIHEIRRRRIVLPPVRVIELLTATAATRAQRQVYRLLTAPLSSKQCAAQALPTPPWPAALTDCRDPSASEALESADAANTPSATHRRRASRSFSRSLPNLRSGVSLDPR